MAAQHAANRLSSELSPIQLGVGTKGGCEAAVHAFRHHAISISNNENTSTQIAVKVDVKNAFNSINRRTVLTVIAKRCPEIYPIAWQAYSTPTPLFFGDLTILSQTGVQQGDPLGSLFFSIGIDPIIRLLKSELNLWYLDDGTIAGPLKTVAEDLKLLKTKFSLIGLELNPQKCELVPLSPLLRRTPCIPLLSSLLPSAKIIQNNNLTLLNSPIFEEALDLSINQAKQMISNICNRVELLDSHAALFFLTNHTSAPRVNYLLRTSPMYKRSESLDAIDHVVRVTASKVTNVKIEGNQWAQASLPVRHGGLGLRSLSKLSLPSYISSMHNSLNLVRTILKEPQLKPTLLIEAERAFNSHHPNSETPSGDLAASQRQWDELVCHKEFDNLKSSANQVHYARLLAAASPHTGAWIQALPSPALGLHLDRESVRINVALRLGATVCEPHKCRCGYFVDSLSHHVL